MDSQPLGNWTHLPHDPLAFFGLDADFDRKQLKRSYGRLIRQYRPETHPAEFQRIRAAYEQLEQQNRYGLQQNAVDRQRTAWQDFETAAVPAAQEASANRATAAASASLASQVAAYPLETYRRLERQERKSPQEYFALAVLSDLVAKKDPLRFLKSLLAGVKAHPKDVGLQRLLTEYLRSDVADKDAARTLQAVATIGLEDDFFLITEALWERALRTLPFPQFQQLLARCERQLALTRPEQRIVFYVRLLRPALWKASPAWIDQKISEIEAHGQALVGTLDLDFEFLLRVREYVRKGRQAIGQSSVRRKIDEMIRAYCVENWQVAAAKVAAAEDELARDSHGVIDAFPLGDQAADSDADANLLVLCLWIAEDAAQQTGVEPKAASDVKSQKQATATLRDLESSLQPIGRQIGWYRLRAYGLPFLVLVAAPPWTWQGIVSGMTFAVTAVAWWTIATLVFFLILRPRYFDRRVNAKIRRIVLAGYQAEWRPRLFRYVQSTGEPPEAALARLYETAETLDRSDWMSVVLSYASDDPGLQIFSRAQAFLV